MAGFAGFDRSDYPGREAMDWLKTHTNLKWAGFYLKAPSHPNTSWEDAPDEDFEGWGLYPIYVGRQTYGPGSHLVSAAQGTLDGADTCERMRLSGFDKGSHVALDLENGPPLPTNLAMYVGAWCDAVEAGGYAPDPDPATSGYAGASVWQHDDEAIVPCPVMYGGMICDLNSASMQDPSAPG